MSNLGGLFYVEGHTQRPSQKDRRKEHRKDVRKDLRQLQRALPSLTRKRANEPVVKPLADEGHDDHRKEHL